jgi:hypothetical protein
MKRVEVFRWKVTRADGREVLTHMTLQDGRAVGAELVPGSVAYAEFPESHDELIESWLTGSPYRLVVDRQEFKQAA